MAFSPIRFAGEVSLERCDGRALGLVLRGVEAPSRPGARATPIEVAFATRAVPCGIEALRDAVIEELQPECGAPDGPRRFHVQDAQCRWEIEALSVHVHRDVREIFFAAVPPRRAPPMRRLFFTLAPILVANPLGRWLLHALRGR